MNGRELVKAAVAAIKSFVTVTTESLEALHAGQVQAQISAGRREGQLSELRELLIENIQISRRTEAKVGALQGRVEVIESHPAMAREAANGHYSTR